MPFEEVDTIHDIGHKDSLPAGLERRKEDYPLITGHGAYVDDIRLDKRPSVLHMAVVRSPYAHARIVGFHLEAAQAVEGVVAVYTGSEMVENLPLLPVLTMPNIPNMKQPKRYALAVGKVRYIAVDDGGRILNHYLVEAQQKLIGKLPWLIYHLEKERGFRTFMKALLNYGNRKFTYYYPLLH